MLAIGYTWRQLNGECQQGCRYQLKILRVISLIGAIWGPISTLSLTVAYLKQKHNNLGAAQSWRWHAGLAKITEISSDNIKNYFSYTEWEFSSVPRGVPSLRQTFAPIQLRNEATWHSWNIRIDSTPNGIIPTKEISQRHLARQQHMEWKLLLKSCKRANKKLYTITRWRVKNLRQPSTMDGNNKT